MYEDFFEFLENFSKADIKEKSFMEYFDSLLIGNDPDAIRLLEISENVFLKSDKERYIGYLEIGYFKGFTPDERILAYLICLEVGNIRNFNNLKSSCIQYDKNQELFKQSNLYNSVRKKENGSLDLELININAIKSIDDSEVVSISGGGYAKTNGFLKPSIIWWSKKTFPSSNLFLRLNPNEYYDIQPPQGLNEEVMIPANPNWWKNLKIYKNKKDGSSYFIEPPIDLKTDLQKHWDYHVRKIIKMQLHAKRNNQGNISLMFEELSEYYKDAGLLMGKCIHLDSDAKYGENASESKLNHLDLAVQFYEGKKIDDRLSQDLAQGMVVDASFRTHIFRIENIPFNAAIAYVVMFFDSKHLILEWIKDQFSA